jgi:hypothetical protein
VLMGMGCPRRCEGGRKEVFGLRCWELVGLCSGIEYAAIWRTEYLEGRT